MDGKSVSLRFNPHAGIRRKFRKQTQEDTHQRHTVRKRHSLISIALPAVQAQVLHFAKADIALQLGPLPSTDHRECNFLVRCQFPQNTTHFFFESHMVGHGRDAHERPVKIKK